MNYKNYLSATCIIKNEAEYMPEWLEYHLLVGFEKFYVYDNESTDNIKQILQPYIDSGIVEYTYWPGVAMQMPAYRDCIEKHKDETFWLAVIDIDEFIVADSGNIAKSLSNFENYAAVVLQWLVYGDNNIQKKEPGLVIERFTAHNPFDIKTEMCKSIVNPRKIEVKTLHLPAPINGYYAVNAIGKQIIPVSNARIQNGTYKNIHINHYIFKSYEEFLIKKIKGDALSSKTPRFKNDKDSWQHAYIEYNHNEIKNDTMMEKYIPLIYNAIRKRYQTTR